MHTAMCLFGCWPVCPYVGEDVRSPVIGGDQVLFFFLMSFLSSLVRIFGNDDAHEAARERTGGRAMT